MPPLTRPKWHDAYDAQMALWRWYRTPQGQSFVGGYFKTHADELRRNGAVAGADMSNTVGLIKQICMSEVGRLIDCDPIFVSDEMCEVVNAAKDSFDPEALLETDLVTPRGFLFYETPFEIQSRFDEPTTIAAASWVMQYAFEKDLTPEQAAHISEMRYSPNGYSMEEIEETLRMWDGRVSGISLTLYQVNDDPRLAHLPRLLPMHLTPWYFGMTFDGNEVDLGGRKTGAEWWWRIIQTTFRLMQQQIAVRRREAPPRQQRHDARKVGFDDRDVVVVRLRRERSGERHEPESEANYSHRFIVSGHWRNQWYPSIQMHRQIWISPYVKGPDELPLIVRPRRVYQWDK